MDLVDWLWTSGALLLGRTWIALALLLTIAIAGGALHDRLRRGQQLQLDPHHPHIRPYDRKDTRP